MAFSNRLPLSRASLRILNGYDSDAAVKFIWRQAANFCFARESHRENFCPRRFLRERCAVLHVHECSLGAASQRDAIFEPTFRLSICVYEYIHRGCFSAQRTLPEALRK